VKRKIATIAQKYLTWIYQVHLGQKERMSGEIIGRYSKFFQH